MPPSVGLKHGRVYDVGPGRVSVHFLSNPALDHQPARAELAILAHGGGESRATVGEGERFTVGDQAWAVDRIEGAGTYDFVVWIAPAEIGPQP